MAEWTHTLCEECWDFLEPQRKTPVRIKHPQLETCCRCGAVTIAGIYYRAQAMDYCDHDQTFAKGLVARLVLADAHIENLIDRVYALENGLTQEET